MSSTACTIRRLPAVRGGGHGRGSSAVRLGAVAAGLGPGCTGGTAAAAAATAAHQSFPP